MLDYISTHEDEVMSVQYIADAIGAGYGSVTYAMKQLHEEKKIVSSDATYLGRRYWLYESVYGGEESTPTKEPAQEQVDRVPNPAVDMIETLVWEYIRATRQTDVLLFLTWLEQKGDK